MKKKVLGLMLVATVLAGCITGCSSQGVKGAVSTDGSTSMEKVIGALGEAYSTKNPNINFTYNPTGSGSGISAVTNGTCDIGLSSRYLKDEEKSQGLKETILAIDGIAIIVNTSNQITNLNLEQIAAVYKGQITNWSELGGTDAEVVVIGREAGSGTRDGFESITKTEDACVLRQELTSTGDVVATVKSNENAIGYVSLASVDETVSVVSVNDVYPTVESVVNGSYVIQRPFVLVTKEDKGLTEAAQSFYDYVLSEEARQYIEGAGVVPAN